MEPAGLGFVGLGRAAGRLAESAKALPNGRIIAACSSTPGKAAEFGAKYGVDTLYSRYEDMLGDSRVVGVVVASANAAHEAQAIEAAAAGKHVFCEKPMGRNGSEARRIREACNRASVVLGVGYHLRFHPLILEAKKAIGARTLGRIRLVRAHFYVGSQYDRSGWRSLFEESGGGALVSTGVHIIDAFHYLLADTVAHAQMICDALPVEEVCTAMLSFRGGSIGMFDTSRIVPGPHAANNIEIYGEKGRCVLANALGGWIPQGSGFIEMGGQRVELNTDLSLNLYTMELADWIDAFSSGSAPIANGDAGVLAADVMDALRENALVCPVREPEAAVSREGGI